MKNFILKTLVMLVVSFTPSAWAATYYVCTATGSPCNASDSNAGTSKTATWLHPHGSSSATGLASSTTLNPGDQMIFRGGDTWCLKTSCTPSLGTFSLTNSGTSGNAVYNGVDLTFFNSSTCGASFCRPIFTGNNPSWTGSGFPASCTNAESGDMITIGTGTSSFITLDNIEMTGVCWTGQASINGAFIDNQGGNTNIIVSNMYIHGWTMTSTASDNFPAIEAFGGGTTADQNEYTFNVIDGSDSPHFAIGDTTDCQWSGNNAVSCYSGQCANGSHVYNWDHNVCRYVSNAVVTSNCHLYNDNLFEFIGHTFASGSLQQHPNVMNCIGGASSENLYWFNNTMRHTFMEENIFFAVRTNGYYFNNVGYDNMNSDFGPLPSACVRWNTVSNSTLPVNAFIYNNTDGDNTCQFKFEVANSPLTQWSGTGTFENEYYGAQGSNCTGTCGTALSGIFTCATGGTCTIVNNGTHVFQTTATQTSQGYTSSNLYQPTNVTNSTVGAGTNSSGSCSTFSPNSDLCKGSSAGVVEQSGSGGKIAVSPAVTLVNRGSSWDVGAFQFSSGAGTVPSPAGRIFATISRNKKYEKNSFISRNIDLSGLTLGAESIR